MAARQQHLDNDAYYSDYPPPRKRASAWPGWLAFVFALGGAGAFIWYLYLPLHAKKSALDVELNASKLREAGLQVKLKDAEKAALELKQSGEGLAAERAQALKEKQDAIDALNHLKEELSTKLKVEMQRGDITILRRGNELVVDVADKILFDTGESALKPEGESVLTHVARTLAGFKDRVIQVGGHTDTARIVSQELREKYPTNWELSTARATNVVRFLEERMKLPGDRLVAVGFAQFRPVASNQKEDGRKQNRRIELVLVPRAASDG